MLLTMVRYRLSIELGTKPQNPGKTLWLSEKLTNTIFGLAATNTISFAILICVIRLYKEKSAQRRRKHCAPAVVRRSQNFSPRRRPPARGRERTKFNQLEMITTFTYRPSLVKIYARNFELSW